MNLDVRIKTTAEGQGAQQTAEGLKQVTQQANAAKAATGEVTKATTSAETAGKDYRGTVETVTKSQDKWTISKRQAVDALRRLRDAVPGLGYVIDALRNPYAAAAAAIAAFIVVVQRQIEKQKQLAQESADLSADLEALRVSLGHQGDAFDGVAESAEQFRQALADIRDEQEGLDAQTRDETRRIDLTARREKRIHEAGFAQQEAELELAVERGEITPEQARSRKRLLRAGLDANLAQIDQAALDQKAQVTANAAAKKEQQARQSLEMLPGAEAEAQAAALRLQDSRKVREQNIKLARDEQEAIKKQMATEEQRIASRSIQPGILLETDKFGEQIRKESLAESQQKLAQLQRELVTAVRFEQTQRDLLKGDESNVQQLQERVRGLRSGTLGSKRSAAQFREQSTGFTTELAAQNEEATATAAMTAATERVERQRDEQRILAERQKLAQDEIIRTLRDMRIQVEQNTQQLKGMQGR